MCILEGTGAGQYRRVVKNAGRIWEIDRPWDIQPDDTSRITIATFQGRYLFIGNDFEDSGGVSSYGMCLDCVMGENHGTRMSGFSTHGLAAKDWGWQTSSFCQLLDNEILQSNYWGYSASISSMASGGPSPLSRLSRMRRIGPLRWRR